MTSVVDNDRNISWISHKSVACSPLARAVRLAVFKYGVLSVGCFEKTLLNSFQRKLSGHGFFSKSGNFDLPRAQNTVRTLIELGGEEFTIYPKDGEAKLQVIKIKASILREKIEDFGGLWQKEKNKFVIREPESKTLAWDEFYKKLKRLFPDEQIDDDGRFLVTSENVETVQLMEVNEFNEDLRKTQCVLFSGFSKSFAMKKNLASYFLGKGIDVCFYDPRGILNSEGYITEAGLYNDIEAVGDFLVNDKLAGSYDPRHVCIYGSCGESFPAVKLFKKYNTRGINMILENSPGSLDRVISRLGFVVSKIFGFYSDYIKSPLESSCNATTEDNFDSIKTLKEIENSEISGYVVLTKTKDDKIAPPEEIAGMAKILRKFGYDVRELENDPESSLKEGLDDHHLTSPIRNPHLQSAFVRALFI